mgnify:CR=1 FL=1
MYLMPRILNIIKKEKKRILDLKIINQVSRSKTLLYAKCSSGTYIRSLVEDIAKALNTFAVVSSLRRVGFGNLDKKLISLDYLLTLVHSDDLINVIKPVNLVFENANEIILDEKAITHILNGRCVKMSNAKVGKEKELTLAKFKNEIVAVGYLQNDNFYPKRLLNV